MSLKQCCATGSLHTGTPTGRIEKVHGFDCYIADAPTGSPKGIVVIIPDAFGWKLPNNRILADEYAKKGNFQVVIVLLETAQGEPDTNMLLAFARFYGWQVFPATPPHEYFHAFLLTCMTGFVMPFDVMISYHAMSATGFWNQIYKIGHFLYLMRYFPSFLYTCRPAVARPRIESFFKALRGTEGANLPIGTAGFCWGAKYVTELCWEQTKTDAGVRVVDCGFIAHPSNMSYPDDFEKVALPLSCAAAEIDPQMSPENAKQTEEILKAKTAKSKDQGVEHEFVMYEKAHHGFAVRADEEDVEEAERGKKAEAQAVEWFKRWFAGPPPS